MGWTVCANCKGRGKTGCPPLMYATVERRAKMRRSTASDDPDSEVPIDHLRRGHDRRSAPAEGGRADLRRPRDRGGVRAGVGREAELLQGMRGQDRAVRVRRVQPNEIEKQLAVRSSSDGGWGRRGQWRDPANPPPPPP